ncbi:hypothetical protein WA588_000263, partial [Blastocystis sp. NMH]
MSENQTTGSNNTPLGSSKEGENPASSSLNPYIPKYMVQAPWYTDQGSKDQLHHQRADDRDSKFDDIHTSYKRGQFIGQATKYRKGACKNCGSMTHTEKDCFYPPRKRGAWKTNKDIKPDEYINPELHLSYEGKRDRWNGVDANAVVQRQRELMKMVDAERQRLHAEEVNSKFQTDPDGDHRRYYSSTITKEQHDREKLVEDGDQLDVHISDSDSDSDELVDMNAVDSSKKRVEYDKRIKTSARDMRIREDIAYYLKNLDDDSTDRRDYSSDGIGKNADGTQKLRADQVLDTGDMSDFRQAQLFAWEAHTKGVNIHLEAQPTATALLRKQAEERKQQLEAMLRKKLETRYGVSLQQLASVPSVEESDVYVEYDHSGKVVKGTPVSIPKSKYEEDVYPLNHTSVWGSWYNKEKKQWGYACCHQCLRNAYCT